MDDGDGPTSRSGQLPDVDPRELISALLARVHDIVVVSDAGNVIRFVNDAVIEHLGFTPESVVGQPLEAFVADSDSAWVAAAIARWEGRLGRPQGNEVDLVCADGSIRRFHYRSQMGTELFGAGGFVLTLSPAGPDDRRDDLVPVLIENTNRVARIAAAFLDDSTGNFGAVLDSVVRELSGLEWLMRITVWTVSGSQVLRSAWWDAAHQAPSTPPPEHLPIDASPMMRRILAGNEVRLRTDREGDGQFDMERQEFAAAGTKSLFAAPLTAGDVVLGFIVLESTIDAVIDGAAHEATVRAAAAVIAAAMVRHRAEGELAYQARTDRTTGLLNRWAAQGDLADTLTGLEGGHSSGVGIVGIDLDRFKLVNEALGHRSGDRLLSEVSDRVRSAAPAAAQLARLSADEFLVVVPDADSADVTVDVARKILDVFTVPFDVGGTVTSVTARTAVVHVAPDDDQIPSAEEVLRQVANTLDQAKRSGRVIETADRSDDRQLQRLRRVGELEHALATGQLVPYFQAEWDLRTGKIVGAEALLRWIHPDLGVVGPDAVIPLAESTGLIGRIGREILVESCKRAIGWLGVVDDFVLRVNVSAQQLRSDDFTVEVADALMEAGFPAPSLCLELIESSLLDDPARSQAHFAHLRDLGVGLAIDDFGTGYSSILQLKELPLSSLKIDQRFIAGIADDPSDRTIVEATLELARAFGVSATAEGVEEERQRQVLEELGCERVQGFLFSRPEPADRFTERLAGL